MPNPKVKAKKETQSKIGKAMFNASDFSLLRHVLIDGVEAGNASPECGFAMKRRVAKERHY